MQCQTMSTVPDWRFSVEKLDRTVAKLSSSEANECRYDMTNDCEA